MYVVVYGRLNIKATVWYAKRGEGVQPKAHELLTDDGGDDVPALEAGLDGGTPDFVVDLLHHAL